MSHISGIAKKAVSFLTKIEHGKGHLQLTRNKLELISKVGDEGRMLSELLSRNPNISSLDLAYKAKSNYSIGAFKFMEGKTPYMTGAVSVTEPGTTRSVVKVRFSAGEKGKFAQVNGFIDGSDVSAAEDLAVRFSHRGGTVEGNISSGKDKAAAAAHFKIKESVVDEFDWDYYVLDADEALRGYPNVKRMLQRELDEATSAIDKRWIRVLEKL